MTTATDAKPRLKGGFEPWMAALGVALALSIVLFWDAFGDLWMRWGAQQELSHSYFIPVISAWLVWTNRKEVMASIGEPSLAGAGLFALACLLALLGRVTESFLFQQIGIVVAVAGLTAAFGGLSLLRTTAAPIAFLLFAVPPPYMLITILSWKFQEWSSILGVAMIKLMDIPVFLTGNIIDLGEYKLQVAEACSGLRYLFPFLSLGVMTAYIYRGPLWHKAAIVLATVPITILMNSFRIAVTGALVQAYGTSHAEGALHFFEGWVVFLLCLAALFAVVAALGLLQKPRVSALSALGSPELRPTAPSASRLKRLPSLGGLAALAAATLVAARAASVDSLITPPRADFDQLPAEFSGWRSQIRELTPEIADVIGADDTIVVDMVSPAGDHLNVYAAYLEARRDGRSWHSPRQCIPGGGWEIRSHTVVDGGRFNGAPLRYNRLLIENRGARQLVYYWYPQRGRNLANEFMMRFWLTYDAVTRHRSDGAMVRLMTVVNSGETLEAAEARLQAALAKMEGFLPKYVPL
ncbi:MAG: VPLPA-CTERM-specific exosortase XrtD [Parvularculaceae bacterium]|nr:VPLPA-CTERM-specific exosortase XrtD [Parvularculaceae bacterium]